MHPDLSFEQAPPISVPYRFFLTAPLFGIAAGVLLLLQGSEVLQSRWSAGALAATHLLVAGFMLQAMCGALLQFVPVAAGGNIWRPALIAGFVHPLLVASAVLLVAAFLTQRSGLFTAAAHGFTFGLGVFLLAVGHALWRTPARGATILTLRLSVAGLFVTLAFGVWLAIGLARARDMPLLDLVDVHAAWGLWGWGLMLVSGVSYFVVPMFQLTPAYPAWLTRSFPWLLLLILLLWSMQLAGYSNGVRKTILLAALLAGGVFAATTLYLQGRRRRKVGDTTLQYFRLAMLCLLLLPVFLAMSLFYPELQEDPRFPVGMGVLVIVGVFFSTISGMFYKIVPFLGWLHLQRACGLHSMPPTMNQMLQESSMRHQFHVHLATLLALSVAVWVPPAAQLAGGLFVIDCGWLGLNLLRAVGAYRRFKGRILAAA